MWEELPQDMVNVIALYTRIKDGIYATQVSKQWHKAWNHEVIWQEYVQRIPGSKRIVEEISERNPSLQLDYKSLIKELLTPKLIILENLTNGPVSYTSHVSGDGKTLVGYALNKNLESKFLPFTWTQKNGVNFIDAANNQTSYAASSSRDGKIVVGYEPDGRTSRAFKWTQKTGKIPLKK